MRIEHYRRGWFAKAVSPGRSTTYLAVIKEPGAHFNGTIFQLTSADSIKLYDEREKYYCRVAVPLSAVHPLSRHTLSTGEFWIYEVKPAFMAYPSAHYPIVQSYVDIFLSGCLEIQTKFHLLRFAAECIDSTDHWSTHWINDRLYPRRPFVFEPKAFAIDQLLSDKLPNSFNQMTVESH